MCESLNLSREYLPTSLTASCSRRRAAPRTCGHAASHAVGPVCPLPPPFVWRRPSGGLFPRRSYSAGFEGDRHLLRQQLWTNLPSVAVPRTVNSATARIELPVLIPTLSKFNFKSFFNCEAAAFKDCIPVLKPLFADSIDKPTPGSVTIEFFEAFCGLPAARWRQGRQAHSTVGDLFSAEARCT